MAQYIGWILAKIVIVAIFSVIFGYVALFIARHLMDAWQKQNKKKIVICVSCLAFILNIFLTGV